MTPLASFANSVVLLVPLLLHHLFPDLCLVLNLLCSWVTVAKEDRLDRGMPVTSDDDSMGTVELLLSITPATIAPTATKSARIDAVAISFFLYYYWLISFFDS